MSALRHEPGVVRLVLATRNPGKIQEMNSLLSGIDVDLIAMDDLDFRLPEIAEDANTLEGNARKKAETVFRLTGIPSLADDTGLEVLSLGGRPGVHSARYAGEDCDATRNRRKLLKELEGVADRSARFRTVVALAHTGGTDLFQGECKGRIIAEERGTGGFGYDSIFVPSGAGRTFAEMEVAEKNAVSHRAHALRQLRKYLEKVGPG